MQYALSGKPNHIEDSEMKNLSHTLLALVLVITSMTGQAAGRFDLSKPVMNQQVISKSINQVDEWCECDCMNGRWICNEPSCGLHGGACDAGGSSATLKLDKKLLVTPRIRPDDQVQPKVLPADRFTAKPRF